MLALTRITALPEMAPMRSARAGITTKPESVLIEVNAVVYRPWATGIAWAGLVPVHSSGTPICAYAAIGSWPI